MEHSHSRVADKFPGHKDPAYKTKDKEAINNWIKSLDTSKMSVIERMTLDINRRELLKAGSLESNDSKPKPTNNQVFERLTQDISRRTEHQKLVENFKKSQEKESLTSKKVGSKDQVNRVVSRLNADALLREEQEKLRQRFKELQEEQNIVRSQCVDVAQQIEIGKRLNSEAQRREEKLKTLRKQKEVLEKQEIHRMQHKLHPNRKPDPLVLERLTKVRSNSITSEQSAKQSKRVFNLEETKRSGERLMNSHKHLRRSETPKITTKRVSAQELTSIVDRLYHNKSFERQRASSKPDTRHKNNRKPRSSLSRKSVTPQLKPCETEVCPVPALYIPKPQKIPEDYRTEDNESLVVTNNTTSYAENTSEQTTCRGPVLPKNNSFRKSLTPNLKARQLSIQKLHNSAKLVGIKDLDKKVFELVSKEIVLPLVENCETPNKLEDQENHKEFPLLRTLDLGNYSPKISEESIYLMRNPLGELNAVSPANKPQITNSFDTYKFIVGITETGEFIYED